jgi:hypothetical protein
MSARVIVEKEISSAIKSARIPEIKRAVDMIFKRLVESGYAVVDLSDTTITPKVAPHNSLRDRL